MATSRDSNGSYYVIASWVPHHKTLSHWVIRSFPLCGVKLHPAHLIYLDRQLRRVCNIEGRIVFAVSMSEVYDTFLSPCGPVLGVEGEKCFLCQSMGEGEGEGETDREREIIRGRGRR